MFGVHLAIDQLNIFSHQVLHIADKSVLAGIADLAEHAFAKKHFAHSHTIQATYQFVVLPYFSAVSIALPVEAGIGFPDLFGDPGAICSY
jgi:hypothetical protein